MHVCIIPFVYHTVGSVKRKGTGCVAQTAVDNNNNNTSGRAGAGVDSGCHCQPAPTAAHWRWRIRRLQQPRARVVVGAERSRDAH